MNDSYTIFTENPEEELWKTLLQYTYKSKILKYFNKKSIIPDDSDNVCEIISGALLQANEYYQLSKKSSLQTAPLLLYYGTINLVLGVATLITGKTQRIENHGMKIILDFDNKEVGNTRIKFLSLNTGGIHVFLNALNETNNLINSGEWNLRELMLSIPEIHIEAQQCYENADTFCFPLGKVITEDGEFERISINGKTVSEINNTLNEIVGFTESYLKPVINQKNNEYDIILRHKFLKKPIDIKAYSGQSFLMRAHRKNGKLISLPQWAYMYIALFVLASLCRYYPQKWNPFIRLDDSGEKLVVDKFLGYTRRILPNIFLSKIEGKTFLFENKKYSPENKIKILGEHEIKELIEKTIAERR